jgi:23S rRNA (adenine2503-C2)-methyltransferase
VDPASTAKPDLRAMTLDDAEAFAVTQGWAKFRGEQIWRWVHAHGARTFDEMSNLNRETRARLAEVAMIGTLTIAEVQTSSDGTRKLRLVTRDGQSIESVLIPDGEKTTQCISSQVGCAVDCQFCATATMGLIRNLDAGEIVDQVYLARRLLAEVEPGRNLTNIVYMGMGEPLHNYDNLIKSLRILTHDKGAKLAQRRVTVSTSGLVPKLERLGRETVRPNLAVSLNAANDETRDEIMPINRKWNIAKLMAALKAYPLEQRRRITFEYVLLAGVNDSLRDAAQLAKLLRGGRCKVNIIPWNPHPEAPYARPAPAVIDAFQNECKRLGMPTYLRTPRGDDIDAACGQLANRAKSADGSSAPLVPLRIRRERPAPPAVD